MRIHDGDKGSGNKRGAAVRSCSAILTAALAAGLVGCGAQPARLPTYPVHGEITCAGKPAVGVHVFLRRADGVAVPELPLNPSAVTDADGRFSMTTYGKDDGAPEGEYVVLLHWPTNAHESREDRLHGIFDKKKISATIKAVADNVLPPISLPTIDAAGKPLDVRAARPASDG